MKRILFFGITNISVMIIFAIILNLFKINIQNIQSLILIAGIFGFGSSIISIIFSKSIIINSINGKIINKKNNKNKFESWIIKTVKNQSNKYKIFLPQIIIYKSKDINAFATGSSKNNSLIAISTSLIKNMKKKEIEAVLAHEITHIYNGDMIGMVIIQGILNSFIFFFSKIISQILYNVIISKIFNNKKYFLNSLIYYFIQYSLQLTLGILATLIAMWYSRNREYYADEGAAKIAGRKKMINALKKIGLKKINKKNNIIKTLYINNRINKYNSFINKIFSSHPSLRNRIKALINKEYK